jgi:hypothetical protein
MDNLLRDAAETFADGLKNGMSDLIRGRESSLTDAMIGLANGALDSLADSASEMITNQILDAFGIASPEDAIKQAHIDGGTEVASSIEDAYKKILMDMEAKCGCPTGAQEKPAAPLAAPLAAFGDELSAANAPISLGTPLEALSTTTTEAGKAGMTDIAGGAITVTPTGAGGSAEDPAKEKELDVFDKLKLAVTDNTKETLGSIAALTGLLSGVDENSSTGKALAKVTKLLQIATVALEIATMLAAAKDSTAEGIGMLGTVFGGAQAGANGGIAPKGFQAFASGGVVNKPTLGLVGEGKHNEAIVPLPDGKRIPVQLEGGGGTSNQQNNSVVVNINNNGDSSSSETTQSDSQESAALGRRISQAVQFELSNQKRAGGQLSPFGTA